MLKETLGTIVYQEQVLEVAMALAGFTSAEAESLRRAMSRKRSQEAIDRAPRALHRRRRREAGVERGMAERVWEQIQGFSGFGFPKAHSAAFGLLAYQSAWLRVHRGPEFLCALLNEQPMGFYPPDSLVHEAQRRGIRVAGPDANRSRRPLPGRSVERGGLVVRVGLGYVKGVREEEMESLVADRERGGALPRVADLASRSGAGRDGLERLAWAGALDELAGGRGGEDADRRDGALAGGGGAERRGAALGEGAQLALPLEPPAAAAAGAARRLGGDDRRLPLDRDDARRAPDGADARRPRPRDLLRSTDLDRVEDGSEVEVAGMVVARQRPETAKGIVFMLLEDERGTVNLIVPPPRLRAPPRRGPRRPPASAPAAASSAARASSTSSSPRSASSSRPARRSSGEKRPP